MSVSRSGAAASAAVLSCAPDPEPAPVAAAPAAGLLVGYLHTGDDDASEAEAALLAAGCATLRRETAGDGGVLVALLAFLGAGDRLVLPSARHLPASFGGLARLLRELDARGADAVLLRERLWTGGAEGPLMRRAAAAVAALPPTPQAADRAVRPRPTAAVRSRALALAAGGARPAEIARDVRVSRMTVWRWMKSAQPVAGPAKAEPEPA